MLILIIRVATTNAISNNTSLSSVIQEKLSSDIQIASCHSHPSMQKNTGISKHNDDEEVLPVTINHVKEALRCRERYASDAKRGEYNQGCSFYEGHPHLQWSSSFQLLGFVM